MEIVEIIAHSADRADVARKLLAAAGDTPAVVRTGGLGAFYVPAAVAQAAGLIESPVAAAEEKASAAKRSNRSSTAGTAEAS